MFVERLCRFLVSRICTCTKTTDVFNYKRVFAFESFGSKFLKSYACILDTERRFRMMYFRFSVYCFSYKSLRYLRAQLKFTVTKCMCLAGALLDTIFRVLNVFFMCEEKLSTISPKKFSKTIDTSVSGIFRI